MSCNCTQVCSASLGHNVQCAPKERYFRIVMDRYIKSADGDCEWDGLFFPGRYATLQDALRVVTEGHPISRFVIDELPRMGMFPAWAGHPEDAIQRLSEEVTVVTELEHAVT